MPVVLDGTSGITSPAEQVNGNLNVTGSITAGSYVGITNGQFQTELFTAPGTWTKPASATQVRVTVIGGGGGSAPPGSAGSGVTGGTSSFGSLVSATGGTGGNGVSGTTGTPGSGTVSTGTAIRTGAIIPAAPSYPYATVGLIFGTTLQTASVPGTPYSISNFTMAGAGGGNSAVGGVGGLAIASSPVSSPVVVTVGAGGNPGPYPIPTGPIRGGTGGAVLVEFVG